MASTHFKDLPVAKPNYSFEKRQRELAKKRKKEEKAQKKAHPGQPDDGQPHDGDNAAADAPPPADPQP
jgi:hypothetical protein